MVYTFLLPVFRVGIYIKPLLVQCANAIVKSDKHREIRNHYWSIKKRRVINVLLLQLHECSLLPFTYP